MIEVIAKIKVYDTQLGRKTPFNSGYRPLFSFIKSMKTSGQITLIEGDKFFPGDEGIVKIKFANADYLGNNFRTGVKFTFGEGVQNIGEGEVIEIL
ncbi:MAG TPA: hypothetical protein VF868_01450 [Bacteroidia bacterium]|jgi:elongation factor Tu